MKTAGIIGGLGPKTTSDFFLEVISSCFEFNKVHRPPMIIFNVPMFFNLEKRIVDGEDTEGFLQLLVDAAMKLEKGGADFIVIPCNSAHIFIKEIRKSVSIPVLSIVEETVELLAIKKIEKVGLLATGSTIKNRLFDGELKNKGIDFVVPSQSNQKKIESLINRILMNKETNGDREKILKLTKELSTDCTLLACTDLQQILSNHESLKIFDTMKILADATVREILKGGD